MGGFTENTQTISVTARHIFPTEQAALRIAEEQGDERGSDSREMNHQLLYMHVYTTHVLKKLFIFHGEALLLLYQSNGRLAATLHTLQCCKHRWVMTSQCQQKADTDTATQTLYLYLKIEPETLNRMFSKSWTWTLGIRADIIRTPPAD